MANAIALSGAIIESVNGSMMSYYVSCNFCRITQNSTTRTSIPSVGSVMTTNYRCKCGKDTKVQIKGI